MQKIPLLPFYLTESLTPLPWCSLSPAELLMDRKLRSCLPQTIESLIATIYLCLYNDFTSKSLEMPIRSLKTVKRDIMIVDIECIYSLPEIPDNTDVWNGNNIPGKTVRMADTPRS